MVFGNTRLSPINDGPGRMNIHSGSAIESDFYARRPAVSAGDEGVGVATGMLTGPKRPILGSEKVMQGVTPTSRLTAMPGQNSVPNTTGVSMPAAQSRVNWLQ